MILMTVASKSPRPDLTQGSEIVRSGWNLEIRLIFREEMMLTEDAYHLIHPTIKVDKMMKNPIKFSMKNYVQLPASVKNKCLKTIPKHSNCVSHIHCVSYVFCLLARVSLSFHNQKSNHPSQLVLDSVRMQNHLISRGFIPRNVHVNSERYSF